MLFLDPYADLFHPLYRKIFSSYKSNVRLTDNYRRWKYPRQLGQKICWTNDVYFINVLFSKNWFCWIGREIFGDMNADIKMIFMKSVKRIAYVTLQYLSHFVYTELGLKIKFLWKYVFHNVSHNITKVHNDEMISI